MEESIHRVAELLVKSKHLMAFSGAGLSQESGIPTFRGDEGIWTKLPAHNLRQPGRAGFRVRFQPGQIPRFYFGRTRLVHASQTERRAHHAGRTQLHGHPQSPGHPEH